MLLLLLSHVRSVTSSTRSSTPVLQLLLLLILLVVVAAVKVLESLDKVCFKLFFPAMRERLLSGDFVVTSNSSLPVVGYLT